MGISVFSVGKCLSHPRLINAATIMILMVCVFQNVVHGMLNKDEYVLMAFTAS